MSNVISSHVRISYRFYQFVTTRYSTDFYTINSIISQNYNFWTIFDFVLPTTTDKEGIETQALILANGALPIKSHGLLNSNQHYSVLIAGHVFSHRAGEASQVIINIIIVFNEKHFLLYALEYAAVLSFRVHGILWHRSIFDWLSREIRQFLPITKAHKPQMTNY